VAMAVLRLEAENLARLLQCGDRHVAERSFHRFEPRVDRPELRSPSAST
jgi:hypothetical protein